MDMMLPLHLQYDSGFGTIADSFKFSADVWVSGSFGTGEVLVGRSWIKQDNS